MPPKPVVATEKWTLKQVQGDVKIQYETLRHFTNAVGAALIVTKSPARIS